MKAKGCDESVHILKYKIPLNFFNVELQIVVLEFSDHNFLLKR